MSENTTVVLVALIVAITTAFVTYIGLDVYVGTIGINCRQPHYHMDIIDDEVILIDEHLMIYARDLPKFIKDEKERERNKLEPNIQSLQ